VQSPLIFVPFVGLLLLTLIVFLYMFYLRIAAIQATGIEPKTRADLERLPPRAVNAANNFQNLFELPVIFYACVLALYVLNLADTLHIICAFGFLVFRILHSAIHCSYNHIMQRFVVYAIGGLFLWTMVLRLAYSVLRNATLG
jgi:hypothetical protein